ncbi:MAG: VIT and VWA domain-containing protein [Enhygromyxa sp.]
MGPLLRFIPLIWAMSVTLLLLGCRTIGSDPWRSAQVDAELERADGLGSAPAPAPSSALDGQLAYTDPGQLPRLLVAGDAERSTLPLEHTDVAARVLGHVAQVRVSQRFTNDRERPIEVVYSFPLPENAAVDDMRMVIGERTIQSEVKTREHARQTFEQARREGHTAALLEQERPNIFTQSLTNVAPGETIEVEISYLQTLTQDGDTFEFVFPMVVGPRFIPPGDSVPDAARINPPILGEGRRTGHDVSLTISVDAGAAISSYAAPTHSISAATTARGFEARLRDQQTLPNRDFVLRWRAGATTAGATLFTSKPDAGGRGHFALVVSPPQLELDELVGRRELIFVVDRSGSMSGLPLALAKQTLRASLSRLRPVDTFNVIGFENGTERLFETPRPANEHNLVLAERFIDDMQAGGGTMMAGAVEAALAPRLSRGVHRYVMFLTDGYIGNEQEIFAGAAALVGRANQSGGRARVFGIGIGSSPNRELIAGLSRAGNGAALYVGNREHPGAAVDGYFRVIDHPILEDMEVQWGGLAVEEVYPNAHLSLFASRSVVVHGRYRGALPPAVTLRARQPGSRKQVELPVTIASSDADDRILAALWARAKLAEIDAATWDGDLGRLEARDLITQIGLEYHLVTAYTSFVALDRSRVVGDGQPERIVQPVEAPEDVDAERAGASHVAASMSVSMSEAKLLPVGGNRDFTAVVDMAPTASHDAAGISLAGTTGAESRYTVEGHALTDSSLGSSSASSIQRSVAPDWTPDSSLPLSLGGPTERSSWGPDAKLRIKQLEGSEGVNLRLVKRALRSQTIKLEACYEQHVRSSARQRLRLRLRFDASQELLGVELLDSSLGADADACVTSVLLGLPWTGLPRAEASVTIELQLWM